MHPWASRTLQTSNPKRLVTIVKTLLLATLGISLLCTSFGSAPPPKVAQDPICNGFECEADFVVFPLLGWEVYDIGTKHGQGKGFPFGDDCDVCKPCKSTIFWTYGRSSAYTVVGEHGGSSGTSGPANGYFDVDTECDEEPFTNSFWDTVNNTFWGHLYCICPN